MTITCGVLANKILPDSWGECTFFWCSCAKKHEKQIIKLTFCPRAHQAAACRIIVNKIIEQLVVSMKVTFSCCNDCDQLRDVRRLHPPVKLEPLEAGGLRGQWWRCFMFLLCVVCCCMCKIGWFSWVSPVGSYSKYNISYYGIVLGVEISIVELDTYAILVKYLEQETSRRKKINDKSDVCVACCKNYYLLITIFPTENIWRTYEGIGICVDD